MKLFFCAKLLLEHLGAHSKVDGVLRHLTSLVDVSRKRQTDCICVVCLQWGEGPRHQTSLLSADQLGSGIQSHQSQKTCCFNSFERWLWKDSTWKVYSTIQGTITLKLPLKSKSPDLTLVTITRPHDTNSLAILTYFICGGGEVQWVVSVSTQLSNSEQRVNKGATLYFTSLLSNTCIQSSARVGLLKSWTPSLPVASPLPHVARYNSCQRCDNAWQHW